MSLGVCRTELLAKRRDARIALCKLGLLGCDLSLLGRQRLGLLLEAGFLLGDELLETIELGGIGSGSDLRNGSRKAGLGLLGRELYYREVPEARVMTAALVMFSREAKSSIIDMYSRGKRKFACLTFELNSTT